IKQLVDRLGSQDYKTREAATRALAELGDKALEGLRQACKSKDVEVCKRAEHLVKKIEERVETDLTLKPTQVHLVCKDTLVKDAFKELSRLSGVVIDLGADQSKFANRKVTLDTGKITFWQAFDKLCEKAGVCESNLVNFYGDVHYF